MDVLQAIKGRRSVRKFEPRSVAPEVLQQLVETGCWAPSADNMQTWRFVIMTDEKRLGKLRMVSPGVLGEPPAAMDAALAAYVITPAAHAEGLGTCIVAPQRAVSGAGRAGM